MIVNKSFYARRALRILPVYYGALAVLFLIVPFSVPLDSAATAICARQWRLWLFLGNLPGGGWDNSEVYWLGHFWFLAVQMHFLLLWPLVVRWCGSRRLTQVCAGLMAAGFATRVVSAAWGEHAPWLFQWTTITKIDGLALGSLIAVVLRSSQHNAHMLTKYAGKAAILLGMLCVGMIAIRRSFYPSTVFIFRETAVAAFFGCLLVLVLPGRNRGVVTRLCESRFLSLFGKYSYGLYIIHNLLRPQFLRALPPAELTQALGSPFAGLTVYFLSCTTVSLGLAFLSWHLYEKHFLRLKILFPYVRER